MVHVAKNSQWDWTLKVSDLSLWQRITAEAAPRHTPGLQYTSLWERTGFLILFLEVVRDIQQKHAEMALQ